MTLRNEYLMRHSDLEVFLAESIWEEGNGSALSILSAFARLDLDPWQEAARLALLPRAAAAEALAEILARLPAPAAEQPNHGALAGRLVERLPKRPAPSSTVRPGPPKGRTGWGFLHLALLLALAVTLGLLQATGQLF